MAILCVRRKGLFTDSHLVLPASGETAQTSDSVRIGPTTLALSIEFRGDAHTQTLARLKTIYTGIAPQTHEATPHASDIRPTRCSLANYSMLGCLGLELSAIVCHHSQWPLLHTYIDRLRIRAHVQMRVAIGMA